MQNCCNCAGQIAQWFKHLPGQCKDLGSVREPHAVLALEPCKPSVVAHIVQSQPWRG